VSQTSSHPHHPDLDSRPVSESDDVSIVVNGEPYSLPRGCRADELLVRLEMAGRRVALAVNHEVLPRSRRADRVLEAGDRVEILEAVGGG